MGEETKNASNHGQVSIDDITHEDIKRQDFPENFMFGVGASAHQVILHGSWEFLCHSFPLLFTSRIQDKVVIGYVIFVINGLRFTEKNNIFLGLPFEF